MIFVLAGNYRSATHFCRDRGIDARHRNVKIITNDLSVDRLYGYRWRDGDELHWAYTGDSPISSEVIERLLQIGVPKNLL